MLPVLPSALAVSGVLFTTHAEEILQKFKRNGGTIIMATHNLERGLRLGDRVIILIKGTVQFDSKTTKLSLKKLSSTYKTLTEGGNA